MKLICPRRLEQVSIVTYLALGWIILVGMRPLLSSVDLQTAVLIGAGGVLYSIGTGFYLWRALPFHYVIWHGFVLVAASVITRPFCMGWCWPYREPATLRRSENVAL